MDSFTTGLSSVAARSHGLFRRCLECPDVTPICPTCSDGEICKYFITTCDQCASRVCVPISQSGETNNNAPAAPSNGGGTNVGAIVGGVVGGLAFIALVTYLLWRFKLKNRTREVEEFDTQGDYSYRGSGSRQEEDASVMNDIHYGEKQGGSTIQSSAISVRSRRSYAQSFRSRMSIPIAFFQGVEARHHDDNSTPAVPAIPLELQQNASSQPSTPYTDSGHPHMPFGTEFKSALQSRHMPRSPASETSTPTTDFMFTADDLRYSGSSFATSLDNRTSFATSAPRQSVASSFQRLSYASTVFGQEAQPAFASRAVPGRANVVSVHSSQRQTPIDSVPDVPSIDYFKYGPSNKPSVGEISSASSNSLPQIVVDRNHSISTVTSDEAKDALGKLEAGKGKNSLPAQIAEAARRASTQPTYGGLGSRKEPNPFSDDHAVPE